MRYLDEYRAAAPAKRLLAAIARVTTRPHALMEVCGGQTHSIIRFGIDQLLPPQITLIHGPGCPVCVTPVEMVDKAIQIAQTPGVVFTSFGDMLRVPGSDGDLLGARAAGADVRMVYSPLDAVRLAAAHPDRRVVFFAVGFETTAPANALAVSQARVQGLTNFYLLCAHVLVPPAMEALLSAPQCRIDGFLAAGHVCTVTGYEQYHRIAREYQVPIVVTGFEPVDLLQGIYQCVQQLEAGRAEVENAYARAVHEEGNSVARGLMEAVFEPVSRKWRGMGTIAASGLRLRRSFAAFDAEQAFGLTDYTAEESTECISGQVLQGLAKPSECVAFGIRCHPERPLGAPMVSSEGACAAYYRYRRETVTAQGEQA